MAILKYSFTQNLASAVLSQDFSFIYDCKLLQILVHVSTGITEDISITYIDNENGTNYNTVIEAESLNSQTDYTYIPPSGRYLSIKKGDKIRVQCTAANTTGTIYGTIQVEV